MNIKINPTPPKNIQDDRKVYLGGESPSFGPVRKSDR